MSDSVSPGWTTYPPDDVSELVVDAVSELAVDDVESDEDEAEDEAEAEAPELPESVLVPDDASCGGIITV